MKTKIAFLCAVVMTLAASPAFAQCGRGIAFHGSVCQTPVVVHNTPVVVAEVITPVAIPVALPVIVPAFTYQYVPPVMAGGSVYPGGPAPAAGSPYPVQPGYAPQQQPGYGQPQNQQMPAPALSGGDNGKLRELAKLLLEEMRRQDSGDNGRDSGPPSAVYPGSSAPANPPGNGAYPTPSVSQPPTASLGGRPNPQSPYAQRAINALAKNCMSCHTGPGSKGEVVIFNQLNQLNPEAPFRTMLREVQQGRMPPRQSNWALNQQEFQDINAWLEGR